MSSSSGFLDSSGLKVKTQQPSENEQPTGTTLNIRNDFESVDRYVYM